MITHIVVVGMDQLMFVEHLEMCLVNKVQLFVINRTWFALRYADEKQKSLVDYSPWGCKEQDVTATESAQVHTHTR